MTIPLSPHDQFALTLRHDQVHVDGKPLPLKNQPEDLPKFYFRHLSGRQQREMAIMLDELEKLDTTIEAIDKTFDILRYVLVDWQNIRVRNEDMAKALNMAIGAEIAYNPAICEDILQFHEAQELFYRVWGYRPTADDLGNSVSQSSTPLAESANPVAAKGA